ncbi:MAG: peptidoglycan-binding protein [Pseudotabrizicola sp.]|uniref:peptidoglycan-binding domain-containing protein n=1 Tax=Pseudotabrizicola sp. TaxID=2939647 RepID=UPI00271F92B4|nr:peptidoglycan-binding protein [Pseudotabrizicola sp.]MDO9640048.1 peptidoglycan-binding protein [Pseudotabrizicola sp.]
MRTLTFPLLLIAGLGVAAPASAQDFGDILSGVAKSLVTQELDKTAFTQAQSQNTVAAYRGYLSQHPQGAYRANAERALRRLGASVTAPAPAEPAPPLSGPARAAAAEADIGLTRAQRVRIQTQLSKLGYPTGVADGLWGSNTRAAIGRWQTANKLTSTGYVTAAQVTLIDRQSGPVAGPAPTTPDPDAVDDRTEERLLSLTVAERREVQRRLTTLGYRTGGVDGVFGANTRNALSAWQRDEGLRATGYITADQLRELRRQSGV